MTCRLSLAGCVLLDMNHYNIEKNQFTIFWQHLISEKVPPPLTNTCTLTHSTDSIPLCVLCLQRGEGVRDKSMPRTTPNLTSSVDEAPMVVYDITRDGQTGMSGVRHHT
jgi:hypothetical protein